MEPTERYSQELYDKMTADRQFDVVLYCPECNEVLDGYNCSKCEPRGKLKSTLHDVIVGTLALIAGIGAWVFAIVLGAFLAVVGALLLGPYGAVGGGVIGIILGNSAGRWQPKSSDEKQLLFLLQRYQNRSDAVNQSALCYFKLLVNGCLSDARGPYTEEFARFLRDFRVAPLADDCLRSALQDASIAHICGLSTGDYEGQNVWMVFDAAYTGSSDQVSIVSSTSLHFDGKSWVGVDRFLRRVSAIEKAHDKGIDDDGIDLRLPSARSTAQHILNGVEYRDAEGKEIDLCSAVAKELAALRWKQLFLGDGGKTGDLVTLDILPSNCQEVDEAVRRDTDMLAMNSAVYYSEFARLLQAQRWKYRQLIAARLNESATVSQTIAETIQQSKAPWSWSPLMLVVLPLSGGAGLLYWIDTPLGRSRSTGIYETMAAIGVVCFLLGAALTLMQRSQRNRIIKILTSDQASRA